MKELTHEQEILITEANKEKKIMGEIEKEEKQYKKIPINHKRFDRILKKIGRKKLDDNETYSDL